MVIARSACPKCGHVLSWYDLIPVLSFIFVRGRCRYCKESISFKYPFVEFLTGLVFILPFLKNPPLAVVSADFWIAILFGTILVVLSAYDLWYMMIPDYFSIPAIVGVGVLQAFVYGFAAFPFLFAALGAAAFFLLQFLISRGKWIGGGDIRLGFLIGLMLGPLQTLLAFFIAYVGGSLLVLPLLAMGKRGWKSEVPFGVFLSLGAIVAMAWGDRIIVWYLGFLRGGM